MKKLMKIFKNPLFTFIIGGILFSSIVVIAESINSNEVLYDNSNSVTSYDNVQDVLDDMYSMIDHGSLGFSLLAHTANGLSTELLGGLYRYQGENVDNYICFGTTNKSTCTSDTNKYMYRIIGINPSGEIKLIKKEALNTTYKWDNNYSVDWVHSDLYNGLNGSYFLTNIDYIPDSTWSNRIATIAWHYYSTTDSSVSTIMERELNAEIVNAKIGLMYLHDYANSLVIPAYSKSSWMHLSKNGNNGYEWSITNVSGNLNAWAIISDGGINWYSSTNNVLSVRPVFFLRASERIASGSGTLSDPYILS